MTAKKKKDRRPRGGATLACTKCGGRTHVLTTRKKNDVVIRDRLCMKCKNRFVSQEVA